MVDALHRAHGWLRPTGLFVDIHPTAEPAYLEVQSAAGIVGVGRVNDIDEQSGPSSRHAKADAALAAAVTRGWFAIEARREFSFHRYADTVSELRSHVQGKWRGAALDQAALQRAATLQGTEPNARLWVREQVSIARLRPLE
jgi:hypothetical protein